MCVKMKKRYPKKCPNCHAQLETEDIYQHFLREYAGDEAAALEAASCYGWTKENPACFSRIVAVYSLDEDRTVSFECPDCHKILDLVPASQGGSFRRGPTKQPNELRSKDGLEHA